MYAKVIVDVPSKQTDRPFDYFVPESMRSVIRKGSRVGVRFGSRLLLGFVVDLTEQSDVDPSKIKSIERLHDLEPALTEELLQLADWMAYNYICPRSIALQAMLPKALKSKLQKKIEWNSENELDEQDPAKRQLLEYIKKEQSADLQTLLEHFPNQMETVKHWVNIGVLHEREQLSDRIAVKKRVIATLTVDRQQLDSVIAGLRQHAHKQKEVLHALAQHEGSLPMSELLRLCQTSSSTVKALERKGLITTHEEEVFRDPYATRTFKPSEPLKLTPLQEQALNKIKSSMDAKKPSCFLLHGVTGSGKTEVYLQAIQHCLNEGKESIVLVPEISLTPQMVERFKGRFGERVAVLHSRLSDGERYDEWRKIQQGRAQVAIGARSAIFAPFTNLGLIILDEEHESSYKQEESPKYHARELALQRAKYHNAAVVLGSATPSLESYYAASINKFHYLSMSVRVGSASLPPVHVVDMRDELKAGNRSMFSRMLHEGIEQRLEREEQTVLLLNRRGYATFVMCRSCGYAVQCPHCDISLTYHRHSKNLRCHYCGYAEREPDVCPSCESPYIRYFGTGTQRVEEELYKHFPGIRVIRMDIDTTNEKGAHEKWLNKFKAREADVLLGTQMVAKGLDFPYVTLVGVIAADTMLHLPDFRASERTFHLLTQVAGRAGRHHLPGEVVVQTYLPEHYSILHASKHDYRQFVETELEMRRERGYPPFCRLALITLSQHAVSPIVKAGEYLKKKLEQESCFKVFGPVPSPIPRKNDLYRFQCIVKFPNDDQTAMHLLQSILRKFQDLAGKNKVNVNVDIDPQMLM